jgi:regulation of enolase protein 1 (concanavalin A-like superfamily)
MITTTVPGLPFALHAQGEPPCAHEFTDDGLRMTGQAGTDLFLDPAGPASPLPDGGRLMGVPPEGDFGLVARVRVEFASAFDAGVLMVHAAPDRWAKLCFEFSPQKTPTAVTVVTRGTSDDANAFEVEGDSLWLRVVRSGRAWAFHASTDGAWWRLLRYFSLEEAEPARTTVGFLAQSPTGQGCTAVFERVTFAPGAPADLRDGS